MRAQLVVLVMQALWELLRYDVVIKALGFRRIHHALAGMRPRGAKTAPDMERAVCQAMKWALSLYWKPALCLQRSVAAARLLRRYGVDAHVVVGYRPQPFFSHAWVEVGGRIVNDSPGYRRLSVLERI